MNVGNPLASTHHPVESNLHNTEQSVTPSHDSPLCSIVIRAHNEERHIGQLLTGIQQQTVKDVETILVDSGSTDGTLSVAAQFPVQIVHIQPEEFTFGYSLNQGIARARAEFVIIASAHVYPVYPDWLECLLKPFSDQQTGLTYGKQRGNAKTRFSEKQVFASWFPERSQSRQPYPFCNNANAAIRRSLWEKQPYDETLPGLEDLDWANRIMTLGYSITYVPQAEIIHVHEENPKDVYNRYRREAMAFKRIFPQEHFGLFDFLRLFISNTVSDLWHSLQQGVLYRNLTSIIWFRWMQFWGTYQGYRQSGPLTWQLRQTFYYPQGFHPSPSNTREVLPIQYNQENRGSPGNST